MAADPRESALDLGGENWRDAYDIICEYYRLALFNSLYCGRRLRWLSAANLLLEIAIAVLASVVAGLTALKAQLDPSPILVACLALATAVLSASKPVLRLGDAATRYAGQHSGYRDVYLAYKDLVGLVRVQKRVTAPTWEQHEVLSKRYRALDTAGDATHP
jgi:hypothetical protein